jgi:hypothetical protein
LLRTANHALASSTVSLSSKLVLQGRQDLIRAILGESSEFVALKPMYAAPAKDFGVVDVEVFLDDVRDQLPQARCDECRSLDFFSRRVSWFRNHLASSDRVW